MSGPFFECDICDARIEEDDLEPCEDGNDRCADCYATYLEDATNLEAERQAHRADEEPWKERE